MKRREVAYVVLRVGVSALLFVHGAARARLGIVDDFGSFLDAAGLPWGGIWAWLLTAVEIAGGAALAVGRWVIPLCTWFIVQLAAGIYLVHGAEGWFVVGAGRNGMEYSVLLIVCLVAVGLGRPERK